MILVLKVGIMNKSITFVENPVDNPNATELFNNSNNRKRPNLYNTEPAAAHAEELEHLTASSSHSRTSRHHLEVGYSGHSGHSGY